MKTIQVLGTGQGRFGASRACWLLASAETPLKDVAERQVLLHLALDGILQGQVGQVSATRTAAGRGPEFLWLPVRRARGLRPDGAAHAQHTQDELGRVQEDGQHDPRRSANL